MPWRDPRADGRVPDIFMSMGITAENVADLAGVERQEMDELAVRSHELALTAQAGLPKMMSTRRTEYGV